MHTNAHITDYDDHASDPDFDMVLDFTTLPSPPLSDNPPQVDLYGTIDHQNTQTLLQTINSSSQQISCLKQSNAALT